MYYGWYFILLLALARSGSSERRLYEANPSADAPRRQLLNEKTIHDVNKDLHIVDCVTKLKAMNVTPFTFYRGSNIIFYCDMADQNIIFRSDFYDDSATPWIQGDMHALNAGRFANDEDTVVYDLNDFDESFVANFLYDVYRLAASIVLIAGDHSISDASAATCVKAFAKAYRRQMKVLNEDPKAKPFTFDYHNSPKGPIKDILDTSKRPPAMRTKMLDEWTVLNGKKQRIFNTTHPDLEAVEASERADIEAAVVEYYTNTVTSQLRKKPEYFLVMDIARRKNAGTGSLGTSRYYVLVAGKSGTDPDDDVILDVKNQSKPCVYKYLTAQQQAAVDSHVKNDADRAVQGYKSLLSRTDDHLGYMTIRGFNYSVRERSPYKKSLKLATDLRLKKRDKKDKQDVPGDQEVLDALEVLAEQSGTMLANAHARSSRGNEALGVPKSFAAVVANLTRRKGDKFAEEVAGVALSYAEQVWHDFNLFRDSVARDEHRLC